MVVTVFVTPVGNAVILVVLVPIYEAEIDSEFVGVICEERDGEILAVCVFEFVVLSDPVLVITGVCVDIIDFVDVGDTE